MKRDPNDTSPLSEDPIEPTANGEPRSDVALDAASDLPGMIGAPEASIDEGIRSEARRLGFPELRSHATADGDAAWIRPLRGSGTASASAEIRPGSVGMVTVCSSDYLHWARTLVSSLGQHHPELDAFVVVADWDGVEDLRVEGAELVAGKNLDVDPFPYMTLKYSACDLCCALKPAAVRRLAGLGYDKILYLDSDIRVFAPLSELIETLDRHSFVVTPHTLAPLPHPERFEDRPAMADLVIGGSFNAGLFALRNTATNLDFIETWEGMVVGPGAFRDLQKEQNSFNWVSCFLEDVHVFRNTAYNVAYWNLHDRSLRYTGLDGADDPGWEVDGRPLVAFHFSGFDFDSPTRLSRHETRSSLYTLPSVARLVELYTAELIRNGAFEMGRRDYRFDRFPSGVEIDERMRRCFREHEIHIWRDLDPWTEKGEAYFCRALLLPAPKTYLVPVLAWDLYQQRVDLQTNLPDSEIDPQRLVSWFADIGCREYGYELLVDMHRPVVPKYEALQRILEMERQMPRTFLGLEAPLGKGKRRLVGRLKQAGCKYEADAILNHSFEYYDLSLVYLARAVVNERGDLRQAVPDFLYDDAEALADWFERYGAVYHLLPPELSERFRERSQGRSLARIFSFVNRNWSLMESFPLAFVGENKEGFARSLMDILPGGPEYDLDDVVMYLWVMEEQPWKGIPLALELLFNTHRNPNPLTSKGQEALLEPVLKKDSRFRDVLRAYREEYAQENQRLDALHAFPRLRPVSVLEGRRHPALHASTEPQRGVNFFGYFKSPIGLGNLSRGLANALEGAGVPVQPNIVGNVAMDRDLAPEDFIRKYRHAFDINLYASYPHLHDRLPSLYPSWVWRDRLNVVYLAWEQRDGSPYWPEVFAGFDQVWALSSFAAEGLSHWMEREVLAVPCVVDYDRFPAAVEKEEVGLDPERFVFLYVFDANSSIERKNPEAAIDAFARAFRPSDPVRLILKVSNHHRLEHRRRLVSLERRAAATGLDILFLRGNLSHERLMQTLSAVDCYVSLHRAEGFGYTCAEAMGYGLPVIATRYSGNLDFMDDENSFLVDCEETMVKVADGPFQRGSVWAEPSVEHAAELLRRVFDDPEGARARGRRAAEDVRRALSAERIGRIARKALYGE